MDVTNAEQARIAENAGAVAVMAWSACPPTSAARAAWSHGLGGEIREIIEEVSIPVMGQVPDRPLRGSADPRGPGRGTTSTRAKCSPRR